MSASAFAGFTPSRASLRRIARVQAAVDRATDADRRFFERRPDRTYRVRLASAAEVETAGAVNDGRAVPGRGARFVVLVRKLAPDVRMRVMARAHEWKAGDLDSVSDEEAGRAYRYTCRPGTEAFRAEAEAIASLRAAGLLT